MQRETSIPEPLRPVIGWSVALCVMVAIAPWLSGGQEPLALLLSGFALLTGAVLLGRQPSVRSLKRGPLVWTYAAVVGWALLSLVWSVNRYSTMKWVVLLGLAALVFRLVFALCGEAIWRHRLVQLYLVSVVAFCSYALWLYVATGYERLTGSFYWPNPAAAYLIPALFLSFELWRRGTGRWLKVASQWWYGTMAAIFSISFVLTDSRAATAVLAVLVVVYLVFTDKNRGLWIKLVFNIGLTILGFLLFIWVRHELQPKAVAVAPGTRVVQVANGTSQSGRDRIAYLQATVQIWLDHALIGTGAGTFSDVHPQYQRRVVSASASAHNMYAQTLAEQGAIGAMLVLWLLLVVVGGLGRGLWISRGSSLPIVLGAAGLFMHLGLDIDAQYPAIVLLAAALVGLGYGQRARFGRLGWRVPVLAIVTILPLVSLYLSDAAAQKGQVAQSNGDYEMAADNFAKAHSYPLYDPDVLTAQGIEDYTLAQSGASKEAKSALAMARAAEHQDVADGQHYQLEGRVLALQGHNGAAAKAYRAALRHDPYNHPEYAYDLALVQVRSGDVVGSLATAEAMLKQYPPSVVANRAADPDIRANLAELAALVGSIKLQQGDLVGAQAASRQATTFDPQSLRAQALKHVVGL